MKISEKYKLISIFSFISLIIIVISLFVILWNQLSMNPHVHIGNLIYFLLLLILIFASFSFVYGRLSESSNYIQMESPDEISYEEVPKTNQKTDERTGSPFDVDLDVLAGRIVPRIDHSESTEESAGKILINLAREFKIGQGIIYLKDPKKDLFTAVSTFAYSSEKAPAAFMTGEGISGQAAKSKKITHLSNIPEGYLRIVSGLGSSSPRHLLILPLLLHKECIGIIELATFHSVDEKTEWILKNLARIIGNFFISKEKNRKNS